MQNFKKLLVKKNFSRYIHVRFQPVIAANTYNPFASAKYVLNIFKIIIISEEYVVF